MIPHLAAAFLIAWPVAGDASELLDASPEAAMGEELRELFYIEPDLVAPAVGPTPSVVTQIARGLYSDEIASDLARIEREAAALFSSDRTMLGAAEGPVRIALFIRPDCADCALARKELDALATRLGVRAAVIDVTTPSDAGIMARLTLDTVPSYAMQDKLIRGQMPGIVLERYLAE